MELTLPTYLVTLPSSFFAKLHFNWISISQMMAFLTSKRRTCAAAVAVGHQGTSCTKTSITPLHPHYQLSPEIRLQLSPYLSPPFTTYLELNLSLWPFSFLSIPLFLYYCYISLFYFFLFIFLSLSSLIFQSLSMAFLPFSIYSTLSFSNSSLLLSFNPPYYLLCSLS